MTAGARKIRRYREVAVELVEIGEIVEEEGLLPKGSDRAQEDENRDKDVAGRVAEVAGELALEDGKDYSA